MRTVLVLVLVLIFCVLVEGGASALRPFSPSSSSAVAVAAPPCQGFFQCWLASLVLHIPDETINLDMKQFGLPGVMVISIKDFSCVGVEVDSVNSYLLTTEPTISFAVNGIATTCKGNWGVIYGFSGTGGVTASISQTSLNVSAALLSSDGEFATSALARGCNVHLKLDLSFTGTSIFGVILWIFEGAISNLINTQVPALVCSALSTLINVNITNLLLDINAGLEVIMEPPAPLPPLPPALDYVAWNSSSLFRTVDSLLNGLLLAKAGAIDCLLQALLFPAGAPHALVIPVMAPGTNATVVVPSVGSITIYCPNITISGIDSFTELELLHVVDGLPNQGMLHFLHLLSVFSSRPWVQFFSNHTLICVSHIICFLFVI
jgi:hypothetical protein